MEWQADGFCVSVTWNRDTFVILKISLRHPMFVKVWVYFESLVVFKTQTFTTKISKKWNIFTLALINKTEAWNEFKHYHDKQLKNILLFEVYKSV